MNRQSNSPSRSAHKPSSIQPTNPPPNAAPKPSSTQPPNSQPLISVVVPIFNQMKYLSAAIESVLNQTYSNFELILIDDGSTDESLEICKFYQNCDSKKHKESRIKIFHQKNKGPAAAKNKGISKAKGDFITFCDADDILDPNKLSEQIQFLNSPNPPNPPDSPKSPNSPPPPNSPKSPNSPNPPTPPNPPTQPDIVYTAVQLIDHLGHPISIIRGSQINPKNFLSELFFRNVFPAGPITIMGKAECFKNNPYLEKLHHTEDYELMLRLAHKYVFNYLDLPLYYYRRHQENMTNLIQSQREAELTILKSYEKQYILNTTAPENHLMRGKLLYNLECFEEAIPYFEKGKSPTDFFYLGNCYLFLGNLHQAIKYLERIVDNPAALNNLGVTYLQFKKNELAKSYFRKAIDLKSDYLDPKKNLEIINSLKNPNTIENLHAFYITFRELRNDLIPYQVNDQNQSSLKKPDEMNP